MWRWTFTKRTFVPVSDMIFAVVVLSSVYYVPGWTRDLTRCTIRYNKKVFRFNSCHGGLTIVRWINTQRAGANSMEKAPQLGDGPLSFQQAAEASHERVHSSYEGDRAWCVYMPEALT